MTQNTAANSLEQLQQRLPKRLSSWSAETQDRLYDEKTIFEYINGGAEVYKAPLDIIIGLAVSDN